MPVDKFGRMSDKDGTYAIKKDLDMNDKKLKNIPTPRRC